MEVCHGSGTGPLLLFTLFVEPMVGKAWAGKLEENSKEW